MEKLKKALGGMFLAQDKYFLKRGFSEVFCVGALHASMLCAYLRFRYGRKARPFWILPPLGALPGERVRGDFYRSAPGEPGSKCVSLPIIKR